MNQSNSDVQKLGELIKGIRVAMLTTVDSEGCLHSRPMATQDAEFDGTLWFFTEADSLKIHELERDRHVNLSYANPGDSKYVSVSGTAAVVRDHARVKELWSPFYKAWFPKGVDDPNIALLRVAVDKAEYWDSPSSAVVRLIGFAKAVATGKRYGEEGTDHEKIKL
jgi:general stress protein 26